MVYGIKYDYRDLSLTRDAWLPVFPFLFRDSEFTPHKMPN